MSTIPGNPHASLLLGMGLGVLHAWMEREGETDATMVATAIEAQTQATLALAYEQRTANLLQIASTSQVRALLTDAQIAAVKDQITYRLGLGGGAQ